jgi:hypothetical protein
LDWVVRNVLRRPTSLRSALLRVLPACAFLSSEEKREEIGVSHVLFVQCGKETQKRFVFDLGFFPQDKQHSHRCCDDSDA